MTGYEGLRLYGVAISVTTRFIYVYEWLLITLAKDRLF